MGGVMETRRARRMSRVLASVAFVGALGATVGFAAPASASSGASTTAPGPAISVYTPGAACGGLTHLGTNWPSPPVSPSAESHWGTVYFC